MTIDLLPTIAHLIGAELPERRIDGKNIWPLFISNDAKSPHEAYYLYQGNMLHAVRQGKWKLHYPHGYRTMAGKPGGTGGIPTNYSQAKIGLSLFDMENDMGETKNLKDQFPEVTQRLVELGKSFNKELVASKRPAGKI